MIFAYDGANAVEELNTAGAATSRYVQGAGIDEPLAQVATGLNYYQADGLGSITSMTDSTGTPAATFVYGAFGVLSSSTGSVTNSYRYTAREYDQDSGLYYYRARYYDSSAGRFISEDPLRLAAGANFYPYSGSDPTDWEDPSGMVRSKAECWKLLNKIKGMSTALANEISKYDPIKDGMGGWPMKWGSGVTKPGGHFIEMGALAGGIAKNAAEYYKDCGSCNGTPSLPEFVWEPVKRFKKLPTPVIPMTGFELEKLEESYRYKEVFWQDVWTGGKLIGVVGTAGAFGVFEVGVGTVGRILVPVPAIP